MKILKNILILAVMAMGLSLAASARSSTNESPVMGNHWTGGCTEMLTARPD
jgi:Spy/CpxP family protein refolding chaperone